MEDLQQIWSKVLTDLQQKLSKPSFETWISNTNLIELNEQTVTATIEAPNEFARDWLEARYTSMLKDALSSTTNQNYNILFVDRNTVTPQKNSDLHSDADGEPSYFSQRYTTLLYPNSGKKQADNNVALHNLVKEQRRTNELLEKILEKLTPEPEDKGKPEEN